MLSLEKVKSELKKYNYAYENNILCGHTKSKIKWVLPTGIVNVLAFEQATSYLFGFSTRGINLFPVQGDWNIADNLFISWNDITNFKMKNGLLENEITIREAFLNVTDEKYLVKYDGSEVFYTETKAENIPDKK